MESSLVQCPSCGESFSITDVLCAELEEKFHAQHKKSFDKKEAELRTKNQELEKKLSLLNERAEAIQKEVDQRISLEKAKIEKVANAKYETEYRTTIADLSNQLKEVTGKLSQAFNQELELRASLRAAQAKEEQIEVEIQRRVADQRSQMGEELSRSLANEYKLKETQNNLLIEQLKRQVEDLNRKLEQKSQQSQGEVFELEIEGDLESLFPSDTIAPVPKGIRGGDLVQTVVSHAGAAGTILWEAKQTRTWKDEWLRKLKEDQRQVGADLAVIVTSTLPKDVQCFDVIDGVWVTDFDSFPAVATVLRQLLLQVSSAKRASSVQNERLDLIHKYLTGTQFRHRVEAIVESFHGLHSDLAKEQRVMQKIWASRDQLLQRVMNNTVGMYGDLQGIMGVGSLEIPSLEAEFPALPAGT